MGHRRPSGSREGRGQRGPLEAVDVFTVVSHLLLSAVTTRAGDPGSSSETGEQCD